MPETIASAPISVEQYRAHQRPVVLLTPQQLFDNIVERLTKKFDGTGIFTTAYADRFRNDIADLTNQLFLVVPPQPKALLEDRDFLNHMVSLIEANGKTGSNYLDPKELKDLVDVPEGASLLTDIEDGKERLNVKPSVSRGKITAEGRHPYTTWRGIVHGIVFPKVFQSHNMDLVGSRCGSVGTPGLCLSDYEPWLCGFWRDCANPKWGAPSCGSVR